MEFDDFLWTRRSSRTALAEIPVRTGRSPPRTPWTPITAVEAPPSPATPRYALTPNARDNTSANLPSSAFVSPTLSPDEFVIQQRGRKRIPVNWSPDIDSKKQASSTAVNRTPPKAAVALINPVREGIVLRSTPKKRLLLNEFDKSNGSPRKLESIDQVCSPNKTKNQSPSKFTPTPKKLKTDHKSITLDNSSPLDIILKGLSHNQLIGLLKNVVEKHPDIGEEIKRDIPQPDLKPFEEKLSYLKRNIFRSLPSSRLTSKTDSPAYARAATHLIAFKKQLTEQGRILTESQHWKSVLDYALLSWSYVRATPLWDNHPHNAVRRQSFKYLVSLTMTSLKKGQFDKATLENAYKSMTGMVCDSNDIQICMKWIDTYLKST